MTDLHLALDAAIGVVLARAVWAVVSELVFKPLARRLYRRVDAAAGDRLPDLP